MKTLLSLLVKGDTFQHPDNRELNLTVTKKIEYPGDQNIDPDTYASDGVGNEFNFIADQMVTLIERAKVVEPLPPFREAIVKSELTRFKEMLMGANEIFSTYPDQSGLTVVKTNSVEFTFNSTGDLKHILNCWASE